MTNGFTGKKNKKNDGLIMMLSLQQQRIFTSVRGQDAVALDVTMEAWRSVRVLDHVLSDCAEQII